MAKYRGLFVLFGLVSLSLFIWLGFGSSYSLTSLIQEAYSADETGDHQDADSQKKLVTSSNPPHEDDAEQHAASGADDQHAAGTAQPHDEGADEHPASGTAKPHDEDADDHQMAGTEDHQTPDAGVQIVGEGAILVPKKPPPTLLSRAQIRGYRNYQVYCVACHGSRGNGDGFNARNLSIPPAKHSDASYMGALSDKDIQKIIKGGGASQGRSPLMPPWGGVLSDTEISNLTAFIRILPEDRLVANAEMNIGAQAGGHHGAMGSGDPHAVGEEDHAAGEGDHNTHGEEDQHDSGSHGQ